MSSRPKVDPHLRAIAVEGPAFPRPRVEKNGYATLSRLPTFKEQLGGFLNAAERELAYQKAQPNPDQNAIAISEREVQRRKEELDLLPKE